MNTSPTRGHAASGGPAWSDVRALFEELVEKTAGEREETLRAVRSDLRDAVTSALAAHDRAGRFLEPPAPDVLERAQVASGLLGVGARVGEFRLISVLGSGGMGTVFEAEQDRPRRRVALKVLHRRLESRTALRRFTDEAQVLATLQHPCIAQVYASGTWGEEGRGDDSSSRALPWFAMELVEDARPLPEYVVEQSSDLERRLALFLEVCDAVHHGHQRGIIHRDLKPANVLVGADGRPRVIDFGVAKIAGTEDRAGATTETGEILGTLCAMSPEQLQGGSRAVDTRTDVYGLGLLLYELLSGRAAFELAETPLSEVVRIVRDVAPPPPSEHVAGLARDLDAIVLTAIDKDRERRYPGAFALAADVRRFLAHEPVLASAPGPWDVARKFVRRHRALVGAAALLVLALAGGLVGTLHYLFEAKAETRRADAEAFAATAARDDAIGAWEDAEAARAVALTERDAADQARADSERARDDAEAARAEALAQRDAADQARAVAESQARRAEQTRAILYDSLAAADVVAQGPDARVVDVLRTTVDTLDQRAIDPLGEAWLRDMLALVFRQYLDHETAIAQSEAAVSLLSGDEIPSATGDELLTVRFGLALAYAEAGRSDDAERECRQLLALFEPASNGAISTRVLLARLATSRGDLDESTALTEVALADAEALGALELVLNAKLNLANLALARGRADEARAISEEIAERSVAAYGVDDPRPWLSIWNVARAYEQAGMRDAALRYMQGAVDGLARTLGDVHPYTRERLSTLGQRLLSAGEHAAAEAALRRGADAWALSLQPVQRPHADVLDLLAHALLEQGRPLEALAASDKASALIALGAFARNDPRRWAIVARHARALDEVGRHDEAERAVNEAVAELDAIVEGIESPERDPAWETTRRGLIEGWIAACERSGRVDDAAAWRERLTASP